MSPTWCTTGPKFPASDRPGRLPDVDSQPESGGSFDRETGALQWALGEDDPASSGDDTWPWLSVPEGTRLPNQQHGCILTPGGTLMLYYNGNDVEQSFGSEYQLDPATQSAELVWSWSDPSQDPPLHSRNGGYAEPVPGNRVLLTHSHILDVESEVPGKSYTHLQMVRREGAETLKEWDLIIKNSIEANSARIYRAHFLPSLYPGN